MTTIEYYAIVDLDTMEITYMGPSLYKAAAAMPWDSRTVHGKADHLVDAWRAALAVAKRLNGTTVDATNDQTTFRKADRDTILTMTRGEKRAYRTQSTGHTT